MADIPQFTVRADYNPYLAAEERLVHAIVQVAATGSESAGSAVPTAAEVVIIDSSGSMVGEKLEHARRAAKAAVEAMRDGTYFAIVAGHSRAELVYPAKPGLAVANARTRAEALAKVEQVRASGGTSMSTWLLMADQLLATQPAGLKHALMLTDGHNVEGAAPLESALRVCTGRFVCDCRGIGANWRPDQLRDIAQTLHGRWKPIAEPEQLAEDFRSAIATSMGKRVPGVRLRVRLPPGGRIVRFARVMPDIEDLTGKAASPGGKNVVEFPLGTWGTEVHDYELRIDVGRADFNLPPNHNAAASAGKLEVVVPSADSAAVVAARGSVLVWWTTDIRRSALINTRVAGYTDQQELSRAVADGLEAWDAGRMEEAAERLGQAVAMAHLIGRGDLLEHLASIVDIEDPVLGRVVPRSKEQVKREIVFKTTWLSEQSRPIEHDEEKRG